MKHTALERRNVLRTAGAAGAAALAGLAGSQPASADEERDDSGGIVGAWLVTHVDNTPGPDSRGRAVALLSPGGTLVSQEIAPPTGSGAGAWRRTGNGMFRAVFLFGAPPESAGGPGIIVTVRPRGRLRQGKLVGTFTIEVSNADTGAVLQRSAGTFEGTRLMA